MNNRIRPIDWFLASLSLVAVTAVWPGFDISSAEELFHKGGIGACDGCHGAKVNGNTAAFNNSSSQGYVLKGSDPSSTCLICHKAPAGLRQPTNYYVATDTADLSSQLPPAQLTPAGDFGWLKKNYTWSDAKEGGTEVSAGEGHGHSIVAADFGFPADARNTIAPEGKYPGGSISCISCHDPHGVYRRSADGMIITSGLSIVASGSYATSPDPNASGNVGVYRMLAGKGYQPSYLRGEFAFKVDPPAAVAPSSYNRVEFTTDTRVAYGSGMSEWCRNCHTTAHQGAANNLDHPVGNTAKFSEATIKSYNNYVATGNLNGKPSEAYNSLVPFEMGVSDYTVLKATANSDGSTRNGPTGKSNVMCLTCHRAHASGWDNIARWNMKTKVLAVNGNFPGTDNDLPPSFAQGRTEAETRKAYYDRQARSFGAHQKSLCNKCHAKD